MSFGEGAVYVSVGPADALYVLYACGALIVASLSLYASGIVSGLRQFSRKRLLPKRSCAHSSLL